MSSSTAITRQDRDFHRIKRDYADRSIDRAVIEGRLIRDDIDLIREFVTELQAAQGLSLVRLNKLTYTLVNWRRYIGPYRTNTVAQIYHGITTLKASKNSRGRPFKQNTLHDYIVLLKRFYLWMIENGYSDVNQTKIQKIKAPSVDHTTKSAEQILSKEEIEALLRACESSRDRAFISVLYESGCRIGELGRLTWGSVTFDEYGAFVTIDDTKAGKKRPVRLVIATQYLAAWKSDYPLEPKNESLVFITHRHTPFQHSTAKNILLVLRERTGITKKITPHLFRHSRITHLMVDGVNESVIKTMMWGNLNTAMFATYGHLSGKDIDGEILNAYGIVKKEEMSTHSLEPRQCPHCATLHGPTASFCTTCGRPLTEEAAITLREAKGEIHEDPTYKMLLEQLRADLGI